MMQRFEEKIETEDGGRFYARAEHESAASLANRWTNRFMLLFPTASGNTVFWNCWIRYLLAIIFRGNIKNKALKWMELTFELLI